MSIIITPIPSTIEFAAPAFTLTTANASGSATTAVSSNSNLLTFDATALATVVPAGSGGVGSATVAARRDHNHPATNVGDATGPGSSVDNEIVRFNATTGKLLQAYTSGGPTVTDTGIMRVPFLPVFAVHESGTQSDVTGDGATYQCSWNTEDIDQGANFASDTFTMPVDGQMYFMVNFHIEGITTASTSGFINFKTSNVTIQKAIGSLPDGAESKLFPSESTVAVMDANDTCVIELAGNGESSNTWDLEGGADLRSQFCGMMIG